jgi:hypothetical protein
VIGTYSSPLLEVALNLLHGAGRNFVRVTAELMLRSGLCCPAIDGECRHLPGSGRANKAVAQRPPSKGTGRPLHDEKQRAEHCAQ